MTCIGRPYRKLRGTSMRRVSLHVNLVGSQPGRGFDIALHDHVPPVFSLISCTGGALVRRLQVPGGNYRIGRIGTGRYFHLSGLVRVPMNSVDRGFQIDLPHFKSDGAGFLTPISAAKETALFSMPLA